MTANIEVENSKIEKLAADLASATKDLKEAKEVRAAEHEDFVGEKKEFDDVESALDRSEADIEKHGASMLQTNNAHTVTEALNVLVKATSFSSDDASKLKALLQSSQESDDSDADMELGAPAAATYAEHGGGTMGVLEKLEDNAKSMEARLVKKEEKATYDFGLLESSLKQDIFLAEREMKKQKERLAEDSETKATSEGDLSVTS